MSIIFLIYSSIFSTIENEANTAGIKITNIFSNVVTTIKSLFSSTNGMSFSSSFTASLEQDIVAIDKYIAALQSGMMQEEAFKATMMEASEVAQLYVRSMNTASLSTEGFSRFARMNQVAMQAQNKSLSNVRVLLNEYNSEMVNCGLSQDDFVASVSKSNVALGNYFKTLENGSKATMRGYILSMSKSVVQTIAFSVAIANTMRAISDLISWLSSLGSESESVAEKFNNLQSELSNVSSELSSLESELSNVEKQINNLLDKEELSFSDKEELARLKSISTELKHQISLSETLQKSLNKSLSATAIDAYSSYSQNTSFYSKQSKAERKEEAKNLGNTIGNAAGLVIGGIIGTFAGGNTMLGMAIGSTVGSLGGGAIGGLISDASYDSELTVGEMLENLQRERKKLETAQEEAYNTYTEHRSNGNKEDWEEATAALNDYNTALATHIEQLASYYNAIDYASLTTQRQRNDYLKMGDDLDKYNIEAGVSGAKTTALDRIFSDELITDKAKELKQAVQAALNSGEDIRFYNIDVDQFSEIEERLSSVGLTITDVISYFKELKQAEIEASDYSTFEMVDKIATLSSGVGELVDAFKEFNQEGVLTAETLVQLSTLFGGLGEKWTNYVDIMTSTGSTTAEAVKATQKLAEEYLNTLLENGGIKLNKLNEDTGNYELDTEAYKTYLATINELELIGVENAKEYIDALQQQAMIQETVDRMIADASDRQALEAKKSLNDTEKARLDALKNKTVDDYVLETENLYGIKISDTSLIQKQKDLEDNRKLAEEYDKYLSDTEVVLDEFENSLERHNDTTNDWKSTNDKIQALRDKGYYSDDPWFSWEELGSALAEGFTFTLADTKYDEYDRLEDDLDAYNDLIDDEIKLRQEYFDNLLDIAKKAEIDLSDIDVDAFNPNIYGNGSIFNQVFDKVRSELQNADYGEVADALEAEIEEQLDDIGLEVDLDLNIDGIVIDELKSSYSLLKSAKEEMENGGGLSVETIQSLAAAEEDYLDYLYEENGLIKLNTEAWENRINSKVDENLDVLREEINTLEDERSEIKKNLKLAEEANDTTGIKKYQRQLETNTKKLEDYRHQLEILETVYSSFSDSAGTTFDMIKSRLDKVKDSCDLLITKISSAKNALSSQTTGESLSIDIFNSEELNDYTSALEYHNGVLQLNAEKVSEIVDAKTEEAIATNDANKAMAQSKYLDNAAQIEKLRQKIQDKNFEEDESVDIIQENIDALLSENNELKKSCDTYDLMSASLREATDAYHNWLNAQNAAESGDMFDDTLNAVNHVIDTLNNSESELFGRIGREDYKAAINLIIPDSVDQEDADAVNKYLDSIYSLFTYDDDGNHAGLNIENFCQKAVDEGLMVIDEASNSYKIAGQKTMEDFAEGLNLSLPLVQAMFGEMEEFGGKFSWADEANKTIGDLAVSANVAAENLRTLHQDMIINLDVSDLDTAEEKSSALDGTIKQMQDHKTTVGIDPSEIEYANSIISYCVTQKQQLENPAILNIDTSKVAEISESAANAVSLLQEFKTEYNNLQLQKSLGVDTTDAQAKVDSLFEQIKSSDNDYIINLGLNTASVDTLNTAISEMSTNDVKVGFNIDDSALLDYQPEDKKATVTYDIDTTAVDAYKPKNLTRTVTYYVRTIGNVGVNGTAHVTGTAMAGGDWGTAPGGKTLTGELGREIVVDPRTGRWYTVGDTGAEFVNIPKGAIVFNHKQTESLLSNGYVAGRASALVGGTAMVGGGIDRVSASNSTKSGGNSTSNYGKSSSSKKNSSSATKEDEPEVFDWIEIAIDRIERAINRLKTTAESTYKALKTKLGATYDEISKVNQELSIQQAAYNRYMQQANSVGLSSDLAAKVRDGTIDISEYDKDTAELIKDYQKWYEKTLDCSDAIQELHESLASLYEDNFNNIQADFDNQLSPLDHLTNTYETSIDMLEARGYLESTKYYSALSDVEKQNISVLNKELADLEHAFSEAMNSGEIEKYSEAWYSMQTEINGVKEAIAEANVQLAEYAKTMREVEWGYFDYTQDRINQITQEADFLIDLMSDKKLYQDNGQFSDEGLATAGLHTQNYNVYMAQADKYAEEILKIDKEIANDPYNTDLIERREELLGLQQDSIRAAEDEKQAIVDMVEEGIQIELDALKELIDTYKDSLDSAKDLYEYQKKISDATSDIASLQKQLSAYENDVSEETQAKVQQLRVDLAEAQEDLAETEYEKFISDTKSLLDNLYTEYEEILNERLDNIDVLLSDIVSMVNENAHTISDSLSGNTNSINTTLENVANEVGYTMTDSMREIWNSADAVVVAYGDDFTNRLTTINAVLNQIQANTALMAHTSNTEASTTIAQTTPTTKPNPSVKPKPSTTSKPQAPAQTTPTAKLDDNTKRHVAAAIWNGGYGWGSDRVRSQRLTEVFGANNGIQDLVNKGVGKNGISPSGYSYAEMRKKFKGYKTGGLVDYTGLAQLDGTPGKPELVLSAEDTKNFLELRNTLRILSQQEFGIGNPTYNVAAASLSGLTDISGILTSLSKSYIQENSTGGDVKIEINIDHVQDYNDFVTQLQKDKQFEKMVRAMSTDQLFGGSSLAKNKYRWNGK